MNLYTSIRHAISLFIITLLLSACGGGSASNTSSGSVSGTTSTASVVLLEEVTGQFIDGPIEGLSYMCSSIDSKSGITDANGEFTCYEGNTVTFKVGDIILGSNLIRSVITPLTLHPEDPTAITNIARLLQTLDEDGDLSSIKIDDSELIGHSHSIDIKAITFETDITKVLSKELVTKEAAIAHLNQNLDRLNSPTKVSSDGMRLIVHESESEIENTDTVALLSPVQKDDVEDMETDTSKDPQHDEVSIDAEEETLPVDDDPTDEEQIVNSSSGTGDVDIANEEQVHIDNEIPAWTPPAVQTCTAGGHARHEGMVTDLTGHPLEGVTVNIGGCEETTGSDGSYAFSNIVTDERAVVNFTKTGHYRNSTIIAIKDLQTGSSLPSSNFLEFAMDAYDNHWYADVNYHVNGAHIDMVPGSYTDRSGKEYHGTVELGLAYEDHSPTITRDTFPGEFKGKSSTGELVTLMAYRFMVIDAMDPNGDQLLITDNAMLKYPNVSEISAKTVPLWYYDYSVGLWIEEGYATRNSTGDYEGTVAHLGTWCLADALIKAPGIYQGNVLYEDRTPAKGIRVFAVGDNWISSDLSTDEKGDFRLEVIPDSVFTLKVYDTKDNFEARFEGELGSVASGDTAP